MERAPDRPLPAPRPSPAVAAGPSCPVSLRCAPSSSAQSGLAPWTVAPDAGRPRPTVGLLFDALSGLERRGRWGEVREIRIRLERAVRLAPLPEIMPELSRLEADVARLSDNRP